MPIKHLTFTFWRTLEVRIAVGILFLLLVLSIVACESDVVPSSSDLTAVPQRANTPTVVSISPPTPKLVNTEPPTLTTVPTKSIEATQLFPEATVVSTSSPTLVPPTLIKLQTSTPSPASTSIASAIPLPTSTASAVPPNPTIEATEEGAFYYEYVIGHSSRGFPLTAYQFGDGSQHLVIVGGIHGGYEWNTILLAYRAIEYFQAYPVTVPESVTLIIIPSANPDGQELVTGETGLFSFSDLAEDTFPGRFNGNNVDLNRNWDCLWAPTAVWRDREISGGESPFSEPESIVLRDFFLQHRPEAVIFLHSAANGVFASGCPDTHQPSMDLARIYGEAAGYPVYERFSAYEVTGDAGDWLSMQEISSISIELKNHENLDLEKNLNGILAVLEQYN